MVDNTFNFSEFMDGYVSDLTRTLNNLAAEDIEKLYVELLKILDNGGMVHFIGNGGSAATPSHSAGDWSKELGVPVYVFPKHIGDLAAEALELPSEQWPTLGLHCLYALMNDQEENEIFIHGFDGKDKKYKYFHYYDIGDPEWRTDKYYEKKLNHADKIEFNHLQNLAKDGKIKILKDAILRSEG